MDTALPIAVTEALDFLGFAGRDGLISSEVRPEPGPRDYLWRDLRDRVRLDAAFFHDGVPIVGFSSQTGKGLRAVRRRLWNYGRVPILITIDADKVSAFNASGLDSSGTEGAPLVSGSIRRADTARSLLAAFDRSQVESGRYLREFSSSFATATRVDQALLQNLGYLRRAVGGDVQRGRAVDKLVGGCLLASYMADRGVLDANHMRTLAGWSSLSEVFEDGAGSTKQLFSGLGERFDGDVFGQMTEVIDSVEPVDLERVAGLLRGDDLPSGQGALWPYDFSVLPADLVSNVYEQLLEPTRKADSAFYTPRMLVDLVLDEVLDWTGEPPKVVDLACGSGAFITEAFRRMAYSLQTSHGRPPEFQELSSLLISNVFGIDKSASAATVTVFGLYLALLEHLDPPTVWQSAVLPRLLGTNVVIGDAFDVHALRDAQFDVVVSNPPWASRLTPHASKFVVSQRVPVPDKQIAAAFLWLAQAMLRPGGKLGLVMPAKPLLHNRGPKALEFRRAVFETLDVLAIVDLSAVRRSIFETAIAPAAILVAETKTDTRDNGGPLQPRASRSIVHVAPHPREEGAAIGALLVAPEEVRLVRASQALARPDLWRVLLWGSQRDLDLLDRLRVRFPPVGQIAAERAWVSGQGFQVGGGDSNDAAHMLGMPVMDTRALRVFQVDPAGISNFEHLTLHRPRDPRLYRGSHTIIRRTTHRGRLVAAYVDHDMAFSNGALGFSGPPEDEGLLIALAATTVSSLGQYWHFMTSSSWGVEREFVEVNEHESLPLAQPNRSQLARLRRLMERAAGELPNDLRVELDSIVFEMYELSTEERERVFAAMTDAIERYHRPKEYAQSLSGPVAAYRAVLEQSLPPFLDGIVVSSESWTSGPFTVVAVTLHPEGRDVLSPQHEVDIDAIVIEQSSESSTGIMAMPAGMYVDQDSFYIVKTADRDRWSRDAALNDADRVVLALLGDADA